MQVAYCISLTACTALLWCLWRRRKPCTEHFIADLTPVLSLVLGLDCTDIKTPSRPEHFVLCWHVWEIVHSLICHAVVFIVQFSSGWDYQNRFPYTTMGRSREEIKSLKNLKRQSKSRMSPLEIPSPLQTHNSVEKVDLVSGFTGHGVWHSCTACFLRPQPNSPVIQSMSKPLILPHPISCEVINLSHQSGMKFFGLLRSSSWQSYFGCTSCQHSNVKCGLNLRTHIINFHFYIINQSGCIHAMHTHQICSGEVFNTFGTFLSKEFVLCVRLCLY